MDPLAAPKDVNIAGQEPSPDPGVSAGSPPVVDPGVIPPAPSPGEPPVVAEPPHEDTVPYDRFKEALTKAKAQEEEIAALKAQIPPAQPPLPQQTVPQQTVPPVKPTTDEQFQWFGIDPNQQQDPQQPQAPMSNEDLEKKVREQMYDNPIQTLSPIIAEITNQIIRENKAREISVRRIPGFQDYETQYYGVPDNIVQQVQTNPETVRFLVAKHLAGLQGQQPQALPQGQQQVLPPNQQLPVNTALPPNGQPQATPPAAPVTYDQLKAQWVAEGEQRGRQQALGQVQTQQGVTAEGGTTVVTDTGETFELDVEGQNAMLRLGIPKDQWASVAKRASQE